MFRVKFYQSIGINDKHSSSAPDVVSVTQSVKTLEQAKELFKMLNQSRYWTGGHIEQQVEFAGQKKSWHVYKESKKMNTKELRDLYLDYVNNFLTVEGFAEYYEFSVEEAISIVDRGKKLRY